VQPIKHENQTCCSTNAMRRSRSLPTGSESGVATSGASPRNAATTMRVMRRWNAACCAALLASLAAIARSTARAKFGRRVRPRVARANSSTSRSLARSPCGGRSAITRSSCSLSSFTANSSTASLLRKYL
jgi:hypothetical protein